MDLANAIRSFVKDARDIMDRLHGGGESENVSPIDLHILEVQLHLLGQEVERCRKLKPQNPAPPPATGFPPFTNQNGDK